MSGPLWFGAECLAAGSSVLNHETESDELRPLARHITKVMETVRTKLREQCLRDVTVYPEDLVDVLRWFDYNWAEFEFSYVSRMVPVKSTEELFQQHLTTILFSETTAKALRDNLITEEQMSSYDPALMLAIPRLAILCGLEQEGGLLDMSNDASTFPIYFRPHTAILTDIKESMSNVTSEEARKLKQCLASSLDPLQTDTGTDELDEEEHEQTDEQTDGGTEIENQTDRQTADIDTDKRTEELQCLYLAVSSIADQMITNHAKDLRQMLHHTFKMNQPFEPPESSLLSKTDEIRGITTSTDCIEPPAEPTTAERHDVAESCTIDQQMRLIRQEPPIWVPDCEVSRCSCCEETFTLLRRKHHCRYCGQIFCQSCTGKTAVLNFTKTRSPVRVCDTCHTQYTALVETQQSARNPLVQRDAQQSAQSSSSSFSYS